MTRYRVLQTPVFESLVDELMESVAADCEGVHLVSVHAQSTPLWSIGSLTSEPINGSPRASAYSADAFAPDPDVLPPELPVDADRIFLELGLKPGLTQEQIALIRRNFAMRNHPDRFAAELQKNATERMMIANALCDGYPFTTR